MSVTIKRQNHRIHPCNSPRKLELTQFLIERNNGKMIAIITAYDTKALKEAINTQNVTIINDEEIASGKTKYDVIISYDLPEKAIVYMARLAQATEYALVVLDAEDQKRLYPIELLLGRTVIQEVVNGFEPDFGIAVENQQKEERKARRAEREAQEAAASAPRSNHQRDKRPFNAKDDGFSAKKQQHSKPRYIGKDENGKPMFDGKTRERNHYIDGTPRTAEEKATQSKYKSKPKFFGSEADKQNGSDKEKRSYANKTNSGDKKGFSNDKKPYDKAKKPFGDKPRSKDGEKPYGDKKPYDKTKKPFGDKPRSTDSSKSYGDKKPYDKKPNDVKKASAPARPPRRINVKSLKPKEDKE